MIETLAVIFTIICVWLTTKRHILSWPIGLLGMVFYAVVFWNNKLYSDFGMQFIFAVQSIVGWITWKNHLEDKVHTKVDFLYPYERVLWFLIGIVSWIGIAFIMQKYTDASVPWVDSFVAVFSLIAQWLLAKRKLENWYIWIFVNVIYIGLFIYKGLYLSSLLYVGLIVLDIYGLRDWKKKLKYELSK